MAGSLRWVRNDVPAAQLCMHDERLYEASIWSKM
jgi:hypothetical protein